MIDQIIPYLKLTHGSFNLLMMFLFIYQWSLGLSIRKKRIAGEQPEAMVIRKHRSNGPIFVIVGCFGYFAGISIVYIDKGKIIQYPLHLIAGSLIAISLVLTYLISKKIRVTKSLYRTFHFMLSILIVSLYIIQVFLGLSILF
jgi:hypothetical protein